MAYSEEMLDRIWSKGIPISDRDPDLYRRDCLGNIMYKYSYGKYTSSGWEVDHATPRAMGGQDDINNLQPMNWRANRVKGCKY